ncbi:Sensor protein FixL [Aliarcobacter thereius]|uniref:histidine kinase n=2 Tax=Aliarcobacter thereius TaxID=544718 RepID=A0A5R9H7D1_9BACT|nr:HAMP domain-containing sensor histidine kinase [Aliarcobacter thereius]OCL86877.1 Sensor protein FixL [Aliarcobacter thereius]OCL96087.1 Sensor protein FixL [Aliarcobacter thereius LMG 24486]QBF15941.1 two-component system sensor histidine kinase [Aliarcobacter thereius LMG 24486]TLS72000.1 HAMP domain-containing histidine kinase [Aliarcobacter thereius]TLS94714.1 HAMP domain-containing histidine kinase [Aliarcobacter thereius]
MNIINNMKIRTKLAILFILLCSSIFLLGYKTIEISEDNKETMKVVHSKSEVVLFLQNEIITPLYNLRQLHQSLVIAPNNEIRAKITNELNFVLNRLDKNFNNKEVCNESLYEKFEKYKYYIIQTKKYLEDDFEEGAYINVTTVSKTQFDFLVSEILFLQKDALYNVSRVYQDASTKFNEVKMEVIISIVLILSFSILIGLFIVNNILQSIYKVKSSLTNFFYYLNDKKTEVLDINIEGKDEFSQMAKMINQNISFIRVNIEQNEALIKNATKVLENIESGNLGTRLTQNTNDTSLNELKNKINNVIGNLENRIQKEIKHRLKQEQILIQQSKLAAMGEMIGNIAHQWRQPLSQISAIHMNMKVTYNFDKFTKEYLENKIDEANKLTQYMSQTIDDFRNFFKPQGEKELFSIEKACRDTYFIVESTLKYNNIETIFDINEDNNILAYKNEFSQVILNLINNAKDILIERDIKNPKIRIEIKNGKKYAIVKIKDNAGGIDKNNIDKIFDPYFTTRYQTQGTGIGLYMAKNIIERNMNGFINVKNSDIGAVFTVKIAKTN